MIIFTINKYNTLIDILLLIIRSNINSNFKINNVKIMKCRYDVYVFIAIIQLDFCLFDTRFMKRYAIFLHGIGINRFFLYYITV